MKKNILIIGGLFLMGCSPFFGSSANAAAAAVSASASASFLGSNLSHEQFVTAAKALPNIRLTKAELVEAFVGPITVRDREWSIGKIPDHDELRKALTDSHFEIAYTSDGSDSELEADIFEIDAAGIIRRPVQIIGISGGEDENGLYENQVPILFTTSLTDAEKTNPLLSIYQYSMTYEQRAKTMREAKPSEKEALGEDTIKSLTIAMRLIKDHTARAACLAQIPEIIRQGL